MFTNISFRNRDFYTVSGPFLQIKSANMHRWNIFLIEALSILSLPQIKTVNLPIKSKVFLTGRLLGQRSVKFQFVWHKLCYNIHLAGLLQKRVGSRDSSPKYQNSLLCLQKMCLMLVWKRRFYRNDDMSTTYRCWQLKLNPLSTQINIYCLMTNKTPTLLVQRAPWTPPSP